MARLNELRLFVLLRLSSQRECGFGGERERREVFSEEAWPGGGGDHGGVVGGEREGGEGDGEAAGVGFGGEAGAQLVVGGDSSGDEEVGAAQ